MGSCILQLSPEDETEIKGALAAMEIEKEDVRYKENSRIWHDVETNHEVCSD